VKPKQRRVAAIDHDDALQTARDRGNLLAARDRCGSQLGAAGDPDIPASAAAAQALARGFPDVRGGGISVLRAAGIAVSVGVRGEAALELIWPFAATRAFRRPLRRLFVPSSELSHPSLKLTRLPLPPL
jgi:hypothetical protein